MEKHIQNALMALQQTIETSVGGDTIDTRRALLVNIVSKLGIPALHELGLNYLHIYLPRFKHINPQALWAEECITQANRVLIGEREPEELPYYPYWETKLPDSISRTFRSAIGSFWGMARCKYKPKWRTEHATDMVMRCITVLDVEFALNGWSPSGYPAKDEIGYLEYIKKLWSDLADELEKTAIQHGTASSEDE